jgi:hypothetical protein
MWAALSTPIDPIRLQSGPAIPTPLRHSDGIRSCRWFAGLRCVVLSDLDAADSLQTVDGVGQCLRRVPLRDAEVSFGNGVI